MFRPNKDAAQTSGTSPTASDVYSVSEFADLLGFPVTAVLKIIERKKNRNRDFYTISELAERWGCSRAKVYAVLRESEFKALNLAGEGNKHRDAWRIPRATVERIEQARMERLPEAAA
jgi:hypothetical protein